MEGTEVEALIKALNRIAEALENGFVPFWFSAAVGIVVPIVLTVLSVFLTYRMDKQNKILQERLKEQNQNFQKELHNLDAVNQTRQITVYVYNSFLDALSVVETANIMNIFISVQFIQTWSSSVLNCCKIIIRAFSQANIVLDDSDTIDYLRKCKDSFVVLNDLVIQYTNTSVPVQMIQNAWNNMKRKYPQRYLQSIFDYNFLYQILYQNVADVEDFKKMCENDYTKNIQKNVETFVNLVTDEKFDNYFKHYVQIQKI